VRTRFILAGVAIAVLTAPLASAQTRLGGSITAPKVDGPTPRLADGKPDFSGVWLRRGGTGDVGTLLPKGETLPLLPEAKKIMEAHRNLDDPQANCLPANAPPRSTPYPFRIVTTPTYVVMLYEAMHEFRQVFLDGRKHPPENELNPSWHGDSIGWWDKDTLVVDTVGFNDRTWFDNNGHPHTEKLHTVERYTRTSLGTMAIEITVEDPGAYSKPFTLRTEANLMPGTELLEYICNENNQDLPFISGPALRGQ
jgi:hypothetical protein